MKLPVSKISAAGTGLSIACAVHCLFASALVALAPVLGSTSLFNEAAEQMLLLGSVMVAAAVLGAGFWTHRDHRVFWLFLPALALLLASRRFEGTTETILVVAGAALLAASQFFNFRLSRQCECADEPTTSSPLSEST